MYPDVVIYLLKSSELAIQFTFSIAHFLHGSTQFECHPLTIELVVNVRLTYPLCPELLNNI